MTSGSGTGEGFTLYLDRAGLCTPRPTTEVVGRADTRTELFWLAKGAAHFERGGRLWATDDRTGTVLSMADMKLAQACGDCNLPVEECDRSAEAAGCGARARREELRQRVDGRDRARSEALEALEGALERRDGDALREAAGNVLAAWDVRE